MPSADQIPFQDVSATNAATATAPITAFVTFASAGTYTSTYAQSTPSPAIANISGSINNTLDYPTSLTTNACGIPSEESYATYFGVLAVPEWEAILTVIVLSGFILLTIVGNILVILSVFTYKPLRIVQNFFIVSLAVADLTVALLVMPFNVAYSIQGRWEFGIHVCKMWLTSDVMCCTSSILNLCAIALDRYWAITDPINYAQKRTVGRVLLLIAGVWILSLVISSPPLVGWNDWPEVFTSATPCELTSNRGYVIYSSLGSFFIPLIIMTIVYIEIYVATRRRLRERAQASKINTFAIKSGDAETAATSVVSTAKVSGFSSYCGANCCWGRDSTNIATPMIQQDQDSFSSETNINNEAPCSHIEHRVVVVTQKKSRRAKIKDSIKHGKMRSKKHTQLTVPQAQQAAIYSKSDQLLPTCKDARVTSASFKPKDADVEAFENSSESGPNQPLSDTVASANTAAVERLEDATNSVCIDENISLKITPPQSSTGAASTATEPVQKKPSGVYQFIEEKQKISLSKERRAARTLGIIMGVFVICWLPFFLMYVILPFCENCCPTNKVKNFITWLGYINSGLNPVIYTIFNIEYRRAFKRLLRLE